jgi:hypothetical protein
MRPFSAASSFLLTKKGKTVNKFGRPCFVRSIGLLALSGHNNSYYLIFTK